MSLEKQYPPEKIETDRLVLKRKTPDMADELFEVIDNSRAHLMPFMCWLDKTQHIDDVRENSLKALEDWNSYDNFTYLLLDKDLGTIIGSLDLQKINWDNYKACIGYWIESLAQGRGLMAEAVTALSRVAYDIGFNRLEIHCRGDNERSQAVALRCGFTREAILRQARFFHGQFYDEMIFARLRDDN